MTLIHEAYDWQSEWEIVSTELHRPEFFHKSLSITAFKHKQRGWNHSVVHTVGMEVLACNRLEMVGRAFADRELQVEYERMC